MPSNLKTSFIGEKQRVKINWVRVKKIVTLNIRLKNCPLADKNTQEK